MKSSSTWYQLMQKNEKMSFQRKYGLRFLQILIILVAIFLVRNCALTLFNDMPAEHMQNKYYEMGYEAGKNKALGNSQVTEPIFTDPLLKKKYRDGFRDGWDDGQNIR
jgi:hypothetical protein